ncbi:MAG: 23S rRNA (adenine(2503)-C(2))-methyltransferase RlmN [Desulfitobacteriaceae bacterium]|nr:23S rRNA (adenine(2503)-C(2))-methyltransferase RlmN [Desulfitobacteriaceae bacterium]MDD4345651.1 23S rRNA (adenine(2503)-C(2))-methyltransferase RlmN [Desulfitobacteriaceae bacterium]MDD4400537.1 23S rRNA (adenine(2503)-C(2))-methyltransferase RlmN [Desulfitobacteriaceae bacterium]
MASLELRGCLEKELSEACQKLGLKSFRAGQLFRWVQLNAVRSWEEMHNIPESERRKLQTMLYLSPLKLLREQQARDGTHKYLFGLEDGECIESVLMNYERELSRNRHTVCISTQVGCAVGCAFCATGLGGFRRNLSVGEIVGQVLEISRSIARKDPPAKVTNLVFMGMGEPLLNYEAVLKSLEILNRETGQNIGMRRMTLSTSGVAPKIRQLGRDNPQVGLAVSLHSALDSVRNVLVPINRRYPLRELMAACTEYIRLTNRRITFEVALTSENVKRESAEALGKLLKGCLAHINLIPVNPVAETNMLKPKTEEISQFAGILESYAIPVSIREERGTDINAACGQLRGQWKVDRNESFSSL